MKWPWLRIDGPASRVADQAEVRVALLDRDRLGRVAALGQDLDEAVPHRYAVVGRQQVGGVTIAGAGGADQALFEQAQVAVVGGARPEVMVVVSRDEPEPRRHRGVRLPGTHGPDELGEGGGGVFRARSGRARRGHPARSAAGDPDPGWRSARRQSPSAVSTGDGAEPSTRSPSAVTLVSRLFSAPR